MLSRSRKQRPVSDIVEELSDFITRNSPFPAVLQNPEALVGSRIKHRFETNGEMKWYNGVVVSFNVSTKEHEVAYDEEENHCFFDLSVDIANKDLVIQVE